MNQDLAETWSKKFLLGWLGLEKSCNSCSIVEEDAVNKIKRKYTRKKVPGV
jgi:hypothetical protein